MKFKNFIRAVWQWPQNLAGYIVKKVVNAIPVAVYKDATIHSWKYRSGLSLGKHIFVPFNQDEISSHSHTVNQYIMHEYGHTVQSRYLGWFYLLIIGLPSIIWAGCFTEYRAKTGKSYYSFYTEKWADKLGGVDRRA